MATLLYQDFLAAIARLAALRSNFDITSSLADNARKDAAAKETALAQLDVSILGALTANKVQDAASLLAQQQAVRQEYLLLLDHERVHLTNMHRVQGLILNAWQARDRLEQLLVAHAMAHAQANCPEPMVDVQKEQSNKCQEVAGWRLFAVKCFWLC